MPKTIGGNQATLMYQFRWNLTLPLSFPLHSMDPQTCAAREWMHVHFLKELNISSTFTPPPIPSQLQFDIGHIARVAAKAYKTPSMSMEMLSNYHTDTKTISKSIYHGMSRDTLTT